MQAFIRVDLLPKSLYNYGIRRRAKIKRYTSNAIES